MHALRVAHLDHTDANGGAELALARMLETELPWLPVVLLPPTDDQGVFASLSPRIPRRVAGVRQLPGAGGGAVAALAAVARLAVQAAVTRTAAAFRTAHVVDANTSRAAAYGALAALTSRRAFVVHLRDRIEPEALGRFGFELMRRVVLPRADGVVANSAATLETARPFLRTRTLSAVIPSAAGVVRSARVPRPEGRLTVGMLARIDPWKGQDLLLDAFAAAFGGSDDDGIARLEFAGGAPFGHDSFARELQRRAEDLGVADRVSFLGHVSDVPALLRRWDVAVQASARPEPLGQNVLQYLAAGCATVVADEGGPVEWVRDSDNGLRFVPRDVDSLTRSLRRLKDDGALRERLAAAAAVTPGLLEDQEVTDAHAAFYAEVFAHVSARR